MTFSTCIIPGIAFAIRQCAACQSQKNDHETQNEDPYESVKSKSSSHPEPITV